MKNLILSLLKSMQHLWSGIKPQFPRSPTLLYPFDRPATKLCWDKSCHNHRGQILWRMCRRSWTFSIGTSGPRSDMPTDWVCISFVCRMICDVEREAGCVVVFPMGICKCSKRFWHPLLPPCFKASIQAFASAPLLKQWQAWPAHHFIYTILCLLSETGDC